MYPSGVGRLPFPFDLTDASGLRDAGLSGSVHDGKMDTSLRIRRRHRLWPEALKREIVAASLAPGASASVLARRYDVNTSLVFTWRKRMGEVSHASPCTAVGAGDCDA